MDFLKRFTRQLSFQSTTKQSPRLKQFTLKEIAGHCTINSCWMVIMDKVYDLTDFIEYHPGGYEIMLEYGGADATNAFNEKPHTIEAVDMLEKYLIGELVKMNFISSTNATTTNDLITHTENMSTKLNQIDLQYSNSLNNASINKNNSDFNENVWILRDEFKSLKTTPTSTKLPNSCLKNSNNQKSNKFVHYAPLISQELGTINTKNKNLNNYTKQQQKLQKPQSILRQSRFKIHFDNNINTTSSDSQQSKTKSTNKINDRQAKRISNDLKSDLWIKLTPDQLSFTSTNSSTCETRSLSSCSTDSNQSSYSLTQTSISDTSTPTSSSSTNNSNNTTTNTTTSSTSSTTSSNCSSLSLSTSESSGSLELSAGEEDDSISDTYIHDSQDTLVSQQQQQLTNPIINSTNSKNVRFILHHHNYNHQSQSNKFINNSDNDNNQYSNIQTNLFTTNNINNNNKMKIKKMKLIPSTSSNQTESNLKKSTKNVKNNKKVDFTDNLVQNNSYEDLNQVSSASTSQTSKQATSSSVSSTSSGISSNLSSASSTTSEILSSDNNLMLLSSNVSTTTTNTSSLLSSSSSASSTTSTNSSNDQSTHHPTNCIKMPIYSNCTKLFSTTSKHSSSMHNNNSNNNKLAPKAIISDDGDIEIESMNQSSNKSPILPIKHSSRSIYSPNKQQEQQLNILLNKQTDLQAPTSSNLQQRHSMRVLPSNGNVASFNRNLNERLSQRIVSTTKTSPNNFLDLNNNSNNKSNYSSQTAFSQQMHQSQLAAAAAAALAMEKEKQREALKEYIKTQQLQQQRYTSDVANYMSPPLSQTTTTTTAINTNNVSSSTTSSSASTTSSSSSSAASTSSSSYNSNSFVQPTPCYSNVLPRKQLYLPDNELMNKFRYLEGANVNSDFINRTSRSTANNNTNNYTTTSANNLKQKAVQIIGINHNLISTNGTNCVGIIQTGMQPPPSVLQHQQQQQISKTPVKRDTSLGLCYLTFGQETKRALLPNQVTGIDTVKALFVRAFPDKLTMNFLDDEQSVKIYIKDQQKELFYQLDEMSDVRDRCVLKLVELNESKTVTSQSNNNNSISSTNWPNNNSALNEPLKELNEYYSPSISMRQPTNGFTSNFQYNTNNSTTNNTTTNNNTLSVPTSTSSNHRSSSEPRFNPAPVLSNNHAYHQQQQKSFNSNQSYQSHAYTTTNTSYNTNKVYPINDFQDFNQQFIKYPNENVRLASETYDNLTDHNPSKSRQIIQQTDHQSRLDAKYNQLNTIYDKYSSIRANKATAPPPPQQQNSVLLKKERDIKSIDREIVGSFTTNRVARRNSSMNGQSASPQTQIKSSIMMGLNAKQQRINELNKNDSLDDDDEDDVYKPAKDDLEDDAECSKLKMKLMQQQLETLTNLVHKALANRDLNHLAQCDLQNMLDLDIKTTKLNKKLNNKNLFELTNKTKMLRNELTNIKKLHESFNTQFGDSMKTFANQLNDKVKSFCLNEINEKIKLDLIVYKYQVDSNKIEAELSDLETVVDDLRENILKHKCNVNIDDVECYALALSQLSKQLVNLKTSFSHMKEHLKSNSNTNIASSNQIKQPPFQSYKYSENKFVSVETSKLDLIIRRCKRITGILIILKKLAIAPPKDTAQYSLDATLKKFYSGQLNRFKLNKSNNLLAPINEDLNKKLLNEIESIKPDHEQRKLAIEVDKAFKQLMTEISTVAKEINSNALLKNTTINEISASNEATINGLNTNNSSVISSSINNKKTNTDLSLSLTSLSSTKPVKLSSSVSSPVSLADISSKFDDLLTSSNKNTDNTTSSSLKFNLDDTTEELLVESNDKLDQIIHDTNLFITESNDNDSKTSYETTNESESEATIKKKLKFRLQKNALKEETLKQEINNIPNNNNSNTNKLAVANQTLFANLNTNCNNSNNTNTKLTQSNSSNLIKIDRSYLETVHEEDLSLTNELQEDNSDCTDATNSLTSTIELGVAVDYSSNSVSTSTNSLTHQSSDNHTLKNNTNDDSSSSSSTSFETTKSESSTSTGVSTSKDDEFKSTDSQLYEQLSQMKPLKPLNFKSSTSICLVNKPEIQTSSITIMPMIDESSSDLKSPTDQSESKMSSSSTSSLSSSSSNGNNHSENAESASSALNDDLITLPNGINSVKNDVSSSSSTCSFGSSGYQSSDNSKQHQQINLNITEIKTEQTSNGVATSMVVIPRRNSTIVNANLSQSNNTATRRVSLSVTDL